MAAHKTTMRVYIGTYTRGASQGIYSGGLEMSSGRLIVADTAAADVQNPSFLAVDSQRHRLYAVSEVGDFAGESSGAVHAFALDPHTGRLTFLNSRPSGGADPCHISVDPAGRFVLAANYSGGSVALLSVNEDGSLGEATDVVAHGGLGDAPTSRQACPHAHAILLDPAHRYVLAADLGLNKILRYEIDAAQGRLMPRGDGVSAKAGAGPRHLAFHPAGNSVYVVNELDSTLTAWRYDTTGGALHEIETVSTLPADFAGRNAAADVHVHPSGRFVYCSNRGHDSLAVFALEAETGRMTLRRHVPAGGKNPRNFAVDPTGTYLLAAHQDTDTIVTFAIDPVTGDLRDTGHVARVPTPVCVKIVELAEDAKLGGLIA